MNERNRVAVIADHLLVMGMQSAGIKLKYEVTNTAEAESAINDVLSKNDVGIVVISEGAADMIVNKTLLLTIQNGMQPIFVRVPSYNQKFEYKDVLKELIARAVGISIEKW